MNQARKDWCWATSVASTITAISAAAVIASVKAEISSPIQRPSSVVTYLGAPGALTGVVLAILTTGSYGSSGTFILTIAALVNLPLYTLGVFGAIRLFRAVRKRVKLKAITNTLLIAGPLQSRTRSMSAIAIYRQLTCVVVPLWRFLNGSVLDRVNDPPLDATRHHYGNAEDGMSEQTAPMTGEQSSHSHHGEFARCMAKLQRIKPPRQPPTGNRVVV